MSAPPSGIPLRPPVVLPVRGPKRAQRLIGIFSEAIRAGGFAPGSKLPTEHEIMRRQRVSRAVVREAIARLQAADLVEARHGIGTFVLEPATSVNFRIDPTTIVTMGDVLALLELRISFETEPACLAARRHTPEQLQQMHEWIEAIERQLQSGLETQKPDFEFHRQIAAATGHRCFVELLNHLGLAVLPRARGSTFATWFRATPRLNTCAAATGSIVKSMPPSRAATRTARGTPCAPICTTAASACENSPKPLNAGCRRCSTACDTLRLL